MYSLVLMAALSTGANSPGFFFNWFGCSGCYGCSGCGGYFLFGCHGCAGYRSYGCGGCYGRGYGSCYGCSGGGYASCYGCYGYAHPGYAQPAYACNGCGGYAGPGYAAPAPATVAKPAADHVSEKRPVERVEPMKPAPKPPPPPPPAPKAGAALAPNRARFIVEVPADAKVFIDEQPTKTSNAATRSFITPELEEGYDYYYVLRAEAIRDGQVVADTQRVVLQPGGEVRVVLQPAVAAKPATEQWTTVSKK